jgi:hypothetical protein
MKLKIWKTKNKSKLHEKFKRLKQIALDNDTTLNALLLEGVD